MANLKDLQDTSNGRLSYEALVKQQCDNAGKAYLKSLLCEDDTRNPLDSMRALFKVVFFIAEHPVQAEDALVHKHIGDIQRIFEFYYQMQSTYQDHLEKGKFCATDK